MKEPVSIGLGEYHVSADPEVVMVAYGLGSCLGISMVDPIKKVSGLLHAVLPQRLNGSEPVCPRYVDCGIEILLNEMLKAGAERSRLIIRMAGGANMLLTSGVTNAFDVGTRNIASAHAVLQRINMRLQKEDVGGHTGRTVRLYVVDGRMTVRVVGGTEQDL